MSPEPGTEVSATSFRAPAKRNVRRRSDWLLAQLPMGMLDDDFLVRFVSIFQEAADSHLVNADQLPHVFDVTVAPDNMVRLMGHWIGVDFIDPVLPDELQRKIVMKMAALLQWRGTRSGMQELLELISGEPATVEDSGGIYLEGESPEDPPHVRMRVESSGWAEEEDLLEIVQRELPAWVTFELYIGERRLWPRSEPVFDEFSGSASQPFDIEEAS